MKTTPLILLGLLAIPSSTHARKLGDSSNENNDEKRGGESIISSPTNTYTRTHVSGADTSPKTNIDAETDKNSGADAETFHAENKQVVSTPTYDAQTMEEALRDILKEFSHMTTSLHESPTFMMMSHPFFSVPRGFGHWEDRDFFGSKSGMGGVAGDIHMGLTRWSPRYEVQDDANNFQVSLDVPGFHFHEMTVELESGGRVLSIVGTKEHSHYNVHKSSEDGGSDSGKRKGSMEGKKEEGVEGEGGEGDENGNEEEKTMAFSSHTTTSFQQKFTLDPSIDTTKLTANLVNGKLVVRAPRKKSSFWEKRHIPITQFDEDVWKELIGGSDDSENVRTANK